MKITPNQIKFLYSSAGINPSQNAEQFTKLEESISSGVEPSEISTLPIDVRHSLSLCLINLPPNVLYQEFGTDVLFSTWIDYPLESDPLGRKGNFISEVSRLTSMDPQILEKAGDAAWTLHNKRDFGTINSTYMMLRDLSPCLNKVIDLPALLSDCSIEGRLTKERIPGYRLAIFEPLESKPKGYTENLSIQKENDVLIVYSFYLDAPVGICLLENDYPQAIVSFSPLNKITMEMPQLQGCVGSKFEGNKPAKRVHSRGLFVINWEKLLVSVVEHISREMGFEETCILNAENNEYIRADSIVPLQRGIQRYNETAKKLGYIEREDKRWYKSLILPE